MMILDEFSIVFISLHSLLLIGKLFSAYMLAEEGVLCSELGKNDAKDVESCKKSIDVVRNMNPSLKVGDAIINTNNPNQPKGCFMKENKLYFNSASGNLPKDGIRQICEGIFCILRCTITNLN